MVSALSLADTTHSVATADTVRMVFTGDILLDRGVRRVVERRGGMDAVFSHSIDSLLAAAQVVVGNLECPATHVHAPAMKRFVFRGEPGWLPALRRHGFTHLNLANNHSVDQGRGGLLSTLAEVRRAGMTPVGAGATMSEAAAPVLLCSSPRPVWLMASNRLALENFALLPHRASVSQEPLDSLCRRIRRLKKSDSTAIVVVSLHWGQEHALRPVTMQRMEAHALVDAGADLLVCHHPHTLQTIEHYRDSHIYYSIGNFIFDQSAPLNRRACVVAVTVTKDGLTVETVPIDIRQCVPHIAR